VAVVEGVALSDGVADALSEALVVVDDRAGVGRSEAWEPLPLHAAVHTAPASASARPAT
jgi:hypothetical protein